MIDVDEAPRVEDRLIELIRMVRAEVDGLNDDERESHVAERVRERVSPAEALNMLAILVDDLCAPRAKPRRRR